MKTTIRYIMLTAIRDRLFLGLLVCVLSAVLLSRLLGGTAMLESEQMTLVFAAASSRIILAIGLVVFVCFHLRTAFETKEIDVLLSRPMSRSNLVFAYWLGFSLVATILWAGTLVVLFCAGILNQQGFIMWALSLLAEIWMVVALSLFAAFTLKSAVSSVLASLGFYVLSRMMGFFIATAQHSLLFGDDKVNIGLKFLMNTVSIVIPRLDFFAKTQWLVYGLGEEPIWFALQAAIYIPLLLAAAVIDFKRKQF